MAVELLLPGRRVPAPKPPSYLALAMAFGVGAGTSLYDKSRYRSHGAITGASWAAGVHGYCLDFNAALPSYVEIPAAHTQLEFTAEDFSIIVRVNFDALAAFEKVFIRGLFNTDGYLLHVDRTGLILLATNQALANQCSFSNAGMIVPGTWYTIGCSRSGAVGKVYRNGVDITTTSAVHINPATCARTAKIGIDDNKVDSPVDGKIEFLRIFRGIALQASEHLAWHNALA